MNAISLSVYVHHVSDRHHLRLRLTATMRHEAGQIDHQRVHSELYTAVPGGAFIIGIYSDSGSYCDKLGRDL
jgi:hypothetical protein